MVMKVVFAVDRIEDGKYVLVSSSKQGHRVIWPIEAMPTALDEGDIISVTIKVEAVQEKSTKDFISKLTKELLARSAEENEEGLD
jgi:hypothetical protein